MEVSAPSTARSPVQHIPHQSIFRPHRIRRPSSHSRKRARLQPRPRSASMSRSSAQLDPSAGVTGRAADVSISSAPGAVRPRRTTVQSDIEDTILRPGTVRINVQGAFIVIDEPTTPRSYDYEHDPKDIRLPNHTAVVSHIAVDVSMHARGVFPFRWWHATTRFAWHPPLSTPPSSNPLKPRAGIMLTSHFTCRLEVLSPNSFISLAKPTLAPLAAASTFSNSRRTR
jgi:hypothetical protein